MELLKDHDIRASVDDRNEKIGRKIRDAELSKQISPFNSAFKKLNASHSSAEIEQLKWMIEEFRVSLFAQDLKTSIPVSAKRLSDQVMLAEKKL